MNRTTCQSVQERLVEFLKLELPEIEEVAILRHLGQCPGCEAEKRSLEQTLRHVEPFGDFQPSAGGFEDLLSRIRADEGAVNSSRLAGVANASPRLARMAIAAAVAAGLTAVGAALGTRPGPTPTADPRIALDVEAGSVRRVEDGADSSVAGPDRRTIALGTAIENAGPHVAKIRIAEVGTLHLDAGTTIRLVEGRFLRLDAGQILLEALPATGERAALEIETPHAAAIVTGTTLDLSAGESSTTLTVLEGDVVFHAGGAHQTVAAGQQSLASSGGAPSSPEAVQDLWRFHTWTTLSALMSIEMGEMGEIGEIGEKGAIRQGEPATLHFQLTNRSASALAIQANVNPPFFALRYQFGDQLRPAWMDHDKDETRFKEIVPRAVKDGVLRLEPGEDYQFSYRLDDLLEPGLYRIEVLYNNGKERTSSEPKLWRGFLQAAADLWVTDATGHTSVPLGLVRLPAFAEGPVGSQEPRPERTFRVRVVDLTLDEAKVLAARALADSSWRDVVGRILAETPGEEAARSVAEVLSSWSPWAVDPANVRIELVDR